jgi:hypothetical protein
LDWLRGCRLRLSVTAVDPQSAPPMVDGLRVVGDSSVEIDLSAEQVAALGLPPGDYRVSGLLRAGDGRYVELPQVDELRVPVRWLHPLDELRPPYSHREVSGNRW